MRGWKAVPTLTLVSSCGSSQYAGCARLYSRRSGPLRSPATRLAIGQGRPVRAVDRTTQGTLPLLPSLGAMLRISLRRSRADWPIVVAAGLICLLASTLLAAGSMYANAVSIAGLHRVLADQPVDSRRTSPFRPRVAPDEAAAVDAIVVEALTGVFGEVGGEVPNRRGRTRSPLPDQPPGEVGTLTVLGHADGLADHASLVEGAWPEDGDRHDQSRRSRRGHGDRGGASRARGRPAPRRSARLDPGRPRRACRGGRHLPDRRSARPVLVGRPARARGCREQRRFDTHGPLFTTREALLARATTDPDRVDLAWPPGRGPDARRGRRGLQGPREPAARRLAGRPRQRPSTVDTDLPAILERAERSLLVSRTGVLLLTIQLVVLAAYAVLLSAALLIEHRRVDTAMLQSRGAGLWRIVALALIEGAAPHGSVRPSPRRGWPRRRSACSTSPVRSSTSA